MHQVFASTGQQRVWYPHSLFSLVFAIIKVLQRVATMVSVMVENGTISITCEAQETVFVQIAAAISHIISPTIISLVPLPREQIQLPRFICEKELDRVGQRYNHCVTSPEFGCIHRGWPLDFCPTRL